MPGLRREGGFVMDKRIFNLVHLDARKNAARCVAEAPDGFRVTVEPPKRSNAQNDAQWPILEAFSKQSQWPVDGEMVWMEPEEWKDVLTAAFRGEKVRLAKGLYGGVVMLGLRTSKFRKDIFSEWLEFLHMVAAERGVELEVTA
jgi:hypothetical protein